ncbi:hypothetical protein FFE93_012330 [Yersinia sp. KBS0713]|uniref:hypothetical protein n=1 Tax=Yersinia TaxID=629 RepID=UPI00110D5480|nr:MULTISPECIES: hypothetical protein [Yersinia]QDW33772.1 hypothetical protein FFE93_012330 [Yersinia sp. KBS0713]
MGASYSIEDCDLQILILVDEKTALQGESTGIFAMDNHLGSGSDIQGSTQLVTYAGRGDKIYWRAMFINPNTVDAQSIASIGISSVGNSPAWGYSGQPEIAFDSDSNFSGEAQVAGRYTYELLINIVKSNGEGAILKTTLGLTVT